MSTARSAVLLGMAGLVATPAQAAKPGPCALIAALAAPGTEVLRGIRAEADAAGRIDLTYRGKPTAIAGATQCELTGPVDMFEVRCRWEHELDLAATTARHAGLLEALRPCMPGGLAKQDYATSVEGLAVSEFYKGDFESDDITITAEVLINTFLDKDVPEMHEVGLSIRR